MVNPVQTDLGAYYQGVSCGELIQEIRRRLGQQPTDTGRYSDADVITAANYGQNRFSYLTSCLIMPAVITLKANRQSYRLPFNTLKVKSGRYYHSSSKTDYDELRILRDAKVMQRKDIQYRGTTGTPKYAYPSYRAGNIRMIGFSPFPSSAGETWTGDDFGIVTSATGFTNVGNVTGTHKTGYAASVFLVDATGRNLSTLGAKTGYPIFNVTDGSKGTITAIGNQDATNDKVTATLSGGTNNYWSVGDSFQIPMSEYGVVIDSSDSETYTFTSYLGTIYDITGNTGNIILDIARKPLPLSASLLDSICEIPDAYQEAVIHWGVYWLGGSSYKGVTQESKAKEAETRFYQMVDEYNNTQEIEESESEIEDRNEEWLS